jgi:hypothetical protein
MMMQRMREGRFARTEIELLVAAGTLLELTSYTIGLRNSLSRCDSDTFEPEITGIGSLCRNRVNAGGAG